MSAYDNLLQGHGKWWSNQVLIVWAPGPRNKALSRLGATWNTGEQAWVIDVNHANYDAVRRLGDKRGYGMEVSWIGNVGRA